jgi:hypothetical protein
MLSCKQRANPGFCINFKGEPIKTIRKIEIGSKIQIIQKYGSIEFEKRRG